jgi:hypothetical protein
MGTTALITVLMLESVVNDELFRFNLGIERFRFYAEESFKLLGVSISLE